MADMTKQPPQQPQEAQQAQEPDPDWENVTAEQGLQMLLAMRDGQPESALTDALWAMPQKKRNNPPDSAQHEDSVP